MQGRVPLGGEDLLMVAFAEVSVIAADIPEVIGTAFALNILFSIPVWTGVLITGLSTLLLLGLQKYGVRKLELLVSSLVFLMAACYFGEMSYVKPPAGERHNLFLHSALVLSRKTPRSTSGINDACRYFLLESGFALFIALLINIAVVSVSGTVCSRGGLCRMMQINAVISPSIQPLFLLKNVLGKSSSIVYAIALLASGQSSAITGTYAGQYIMQGFLDIRMRKWLRNLMTRSIAIIPSLIVSIIGGSSGAGRLIIIASMILSFELPFALIPLLKFSSSKRKMGPHKNSIYIIVTSWILGSCIIGINIYYLSTGFVDWLIHNNLPKVVNVFIGAAIFPVMAIYILSVIYLTFRKDTVVAFIDTSEAQQTEMEKGECGIDSAKVNCNIPFREDLADIPLPQ
ncbi:hypothetical protein J5N97_001892 [Dioscorea zingiberensis]|uniref:Uncharacterized protein n=1 Tax=Dioscorea zingiberensis TaxID=325984 RepID=A0A9D5BT09_9LILI|nr:hypothetical protein J5N97_001892 [Dioscorea zingiberensis]